MSSPCPSCPPFSASRSPDDSPCPAQMSDRDLLAAVFALLMPADQSGRHADDCLAQFGGLRGVVGAVRPEQREQQRLLGNCSRGLALFEELFRRQLRERLERRSVLTSPADTMDYLQNQLGNRNREIFLCLFLDTRHRVICCKELFQGSIDGASVHPRVVAEHALRYHAAAVIVAHNHPSGVAEPSLADQAITRRLKDALSLLEIRLLDHFVIGDAAPVSMASRGML